MQGGKQSTMRLMEPAQMRAVAHPLRLRLLGHLRTDGPATATALAERLEVVPALASYHLRQLAAHGFIEEAPELARDGRERWWSAAHQRTSWSTVEFLDTPERMRAEQALGREIVRVIAERSTHWVTGASTWPADWVEASDMSDWILELTSEELRELRDQIHELIERRVGTPRHQDSESVQVFLQLLPRRRQRS